MFQLRGFECASSEIEDDCNSAFAKVWRPSELIMDRAIVTRGEGRKFFPI